jgi:hypothetical protein
MAGVAKPMLRREWRSGARFLFGLMVGMVVAGSIIGLGVLVVGRVAERALTVDERARIVFLVCCLLGIADLLNRTPQTWRQVPQRLVRVLSPGSLGLVWGLDLGAVFTTQKLSSLVWASLVGVTLLAPSFGPLLGVGSAVVLASVITASVLSTVNAQAVVTCLGRPRPWLRPMRAFSAILVFAAATVTVLSTIQL